MRSVLVFATLAVGCATGDGADAPPRPEDASAVETASGGDAQIFPLEDTTSIEDTAMESPDTGDPDTGSPDVAMDTEPVVSTTTLTIDTLECRTVTCPSSHPYVVGCNVVLGGASSIGCAVHVAGSGTLLFKEGQSCGDITLRGNVTCSTAPGSGLSATNCLMNKATKLYVASIGSCPT